MKYLFGFVASYLMAAPLTTLISFDMRETEWANLLTYVWLVGAWIILGIIFLAGIAALQVFADRWDKKRSLK